jgi:histone-lysine N-methyltransferase SETMAR
MNAQYYSSLLVQLKDIVKEKRHAAIRSPRGSCSFSTMQAHQALAAQKKLAYLGFHCLDHPHYSPDLTPSDYHHFPGVKKQLKGRHLLSDTEVIAAAET